MSSPFYLIQSIMKQFVIVADDKIPGLPTLLAPFEQVTFLPTKDFSSSAIKDANVLFVRTPIKCNPALLEGNKVEYIGTASIGFDHIDRSYCAAHDIVWNNAPGCNKGSVLSYFLATLSILARKMKKDLSEFTVGVVGVGNIGKHIAKACSDLGMKVLLNDPPRQEAEGDQGFVSLEEIAKECDLVTFHTPLTKDGDHPSYHVADHRFFSALEKKPIIMNAARGGVLDEEALLEAFKNGKIGGMIIDCWENEPLINEELLDIADIATPHIAGFSRDGKFNGTKMTVAAFARYFGLNVDTSLITPPVPKHPVIDVNQIDGDILTGIILKTYPVEEESEALKAASSDFVKQRDHYPLRRDFCGYTVINAPADIEVLIRKLGFN